MPAYHQTSAVRSDPQRPVGAGEQDRDLTRAQRRCIGFIENGESKPIEPDQSLLRPEPQESIRRLHDRCYGVLRKAGREARIGTQIDLRGLEPMLAAWAEMRPGQRARLLGSLANANEHILNSRFDAALKALREAVRIVEPYSGSKKRPPSCEVQRLLDRDASTGAR